LPILNTLAKSTKGAGIYPYRAVNKSGSAVDFRLSDAGMKSRYRFLHTRD
jgi:hypothetical protein